VAKVGRYCVGFFFFLFFSFLCFVISHVDGWKVRWDGVFFFIFSVGDVVGGGE
jgi:hypothetical protein